MHMATYEMGSVFVSRNCATMHSSSGTSADLGANSVWYGNIIADQNITLGTGATVFGRVLSRSGAITLDTNVIDVP